MNQIKEISYARLHNAEIIKFLDDGTEVVSANTTVAGAVTPELEAVKSKLSDLNALFINDPASPLTNDLNALDALRDELLGGLIKRCDADTHHPDTAIRAAAGTLSRSIAIYGNDITRQGLNAETTTISSILSDWIKKPELAAAASLLDLHAWTDALGTANNSFKEKYLQRSGAQAATATPDTMQAKRLEAKAAWGALCEKIEANRVLAKDKTDWLAVTAQINALIDAYSATLSGRAGRAAAAANKESNNKGQSPQA